MTPLHGLFSTMESPLKARRSFNIVMTVITGDGARSFPFFSFCRHGANLENRQAAFLQRDHKFPIPLRQKRETKKKAAQETRESWKKNVFGQFILCVPVSLSPRLEHFLLPLSQEKKRKKRERERKKRKEDQYNWHSEKKKNGTGLSQCGKRGQRCGTDKARMVSKR